MSNSIKVIIPSSKKDYQGKVGIDFIKNEALSKEELAFILPPQYCDDAEQKYLYAKEMAQIIMHTKESNLSEESSGTRIPYLSYLYIIQYYLDFGYYTERETIINPRINGRINWKNTIKSNNIFYSDGNIVYRELHKENVKDTQNIISEVYKFCLEESVKAIGTFLFDIENTESSVFDNSKGSIAYMKYVLQTAKNSTFQDSRLELYTHMCNILDSVNDNTQKGVLLLSDTEFEYLFQSAIDKCFSTDSASNYYNKYEYDLKLFKPGLKKARGSGQPDTIIDKDDYMIIIDAKYYDFGYLRTGDGLPESASIAKQIRYEEYLSNNNNVEKIYSVFFLPTRSDSFLQYAGKAKEKKQSNEHSDIYVHLVLIDLKQLFEQYIHYRKEFNVRNQKFLFDLLKENAKR